MTKDTWCLSKSKGIRLKSQHHWIHLARITNTSKYIINGTDTRERHIFQCVNVFPSGRPMKSGRPMNYSNINNDEDEIIIVITNYIVAGTVVLAVIMIMKMLLITQEK